MKKLAWLMAVVLLLTSLTSLTGCRNKKSGSELENAFTTVNVNGGVKITAYSGNYTTLEIPSTIKGKRVVAIGDDVFASQYLLTEIVIPNTVTEIGAHAFQGCRALKEITIPDSVTSIGDYAFFGCWAAKSLHIGASLNHMGRQAIQYCKSLKVITVSPDNTKYRSTEEGILYTADYNTLLCYPSASPLTSYTIPNNCTEIADFAFRNSVNLTTINIGAHVKEIGDSAFLACAALKNVNIAEGGISHLGMSVFEDCTALEEIIIPEGVKTLGYLLENGERGETFEGCTALQKVVFPTTLTNVYARVFSECTSLKAVAFRGNESAWKTVMIGEGNTPLSEATVTYDYKN